MNIKLYITVIAFIFLSSFVVNVQYTYFAETQNGQPSSGVYIIVDWDHPYTAQLPWQPMGGTHRLQWEEEDETRTVYEILGAASNGGRFFISIPKNDSGDEDYNYCLVEYFAPMGYSYSKLLSTWCSTTPSANTNNGGGYIEDYGTPSPSSTYTTCRTCGGSGVCTSCGGKGGEWRDTGYYTGSGSKSWIACPSCNGNKRCFNCHGTGRY